MPHRGSSRAAQFGQPAVVGHLPVLKPSPRGSCLFGCILHAVRNVDVFSRSVEGRLPTLLGNLLLGGQSTSWWALTV